MPFQLAGWLTSMRASLRSPVARSRQVLVFSSTWLSACVFRRSAASAGDSVNDTKAEIAVEADTDIKTQKTAELRRSQKYAATADARIEIILYEYGKL